MATSSMCASMSSRRNERPILRTALVLLGIWLAVGPAAASAPAAEKILAAYETRFGSVQVLAGGPHQRLIMFKNRQVYAGTDFMKVEKAYRLKKYDTILVRDFTGPLACPPQFFFLTLKGGAVELSETFGNCSGKPTVKIKNQAIFIHFPDFGAQPAVDLIFDGTRLTPGPPPETPDQAAPKKE